VPGLDLQSDERFLINAPVGVVHAGRAVVTAVPRRQRRPAGVLLQPAGRRSRKFAAKFRRPVLVERTKIDDRGGAEVAEIQANPVRLRVAELRPDRRVRFVHSVRLREAGVAQGAEAGGVNDSRAARRGGFRLFAEAAEVVERVARDADVQRPAAGTLTASAGAAVDS
jgi:hypothetical protein